MRTIEHTIRIEIQNLNWRTEMSRKTGVWVGICDALRLTVQADDWAELCEMMNESMDLLFRDLLETGEIEAYLRKNGWKAAARLPSPKQAKGVRFDVPANFIQEPARATA